MFKERFIGFGLFLILFLTSLLIVIFPSFSDNKTIRITLDKDTELPYLLNLPKEVTLVFFGYSGCHDICTPRLGLLGDFYDSLEPALKKNVGILFFDIGALTDRRMAQNFASFFHPDFDGIALSESELRNYTKAFGVSFAPSLTKESEWEHSAMLYLVHKKQNKTTIKYIYNTYPYNFKTITQDIKELLYANR